MPKIMKEFVDILLVIIVVLTLGIAAISMTKKDETVTQIAGFSVFMVRTGSMASIEPIGSVILAQHVSKSDVQLGDDIVFYKNEKTRVTHRIVAMSKDDEGKTFYTTKGVNNSEADKEPLYPENIIGKVKMVIPGIGYLGATLQSTPIYLVMIFSLCLLLHFLREMMTGTPKRKEVKA